MASIDRSTLEHLARHHPAWQLLRARHAPFVASFLHDVFVEPNVRAVPHVDLTPATEKAIGWLTSLGEQVRLEQERIRWALLQTALENELP